MRIKRRDQTDDRRADDQDLEGAEVSDGVEHHEDGERAADPAAAAGPDPAPRRQGPSSRFRALWDDQVAASRQELERQAALELAESATPAMQQLLLNVPGSTSYEEAGATLAHQAAIELDKPVTVAPETVIDLRNPPAMGAYPASEKLSNRVLRLANRHWAKDKPRPSSDIVAEKEAIAEEEWARAPIGTSRCAAVHGALRCRGVFAYGAGDQDGDTVVSCPMCGAAHRFDDATSTWVLTDRPAVAIKSGVASGG